MNLLHYDIFRNTANGMVLTMTLYSLLSFFKNKKTAFLLYSIISTSSLIDFYIGDQLHNKGIHNISLETFLPLISYFNIILYCIFLLNMFDVNIRERRIYSLIVLVIKTILITATLDILVKLISNNYLVLLWIYSITIIVCTVLFILIYYHLYQLKYLFVKYYLMGSIIITTGWILRCVFQSFRESFPSIITFDNNNAFTFPNSYALLGNIFESILIFIGISEAHKLSELSNLDLKRKILLSIEEKSNDDKVFINVKQEILFQVNTTFNQYLQNSSALIEDTLHLLNHNNNEAVKNNLAIFNHSTAQSIQTIRMIVKEFNQQSSLTFNKSIESKAFEIAKYHLSPKSISFDLYVNESELWFKISNHFEKQILIFYEQILKIFIKYKDFLHLMTNFAMHKDGNIFVIIQDDGSKIATKNRMIRELNLISSQLLNLQGKIAYSIEDGTNSTVRLDFIIDSKK